MAEQNFEYIDVALPNGAHQRCESVLNARATTPRRGMPFQSSLKKDCRCQKTHSALTASASFKSATHHHHRHHTARNLSELLSRVTKEERSSRVDKLLGRDSEHLGAHKFSFALHQQKIAPFQTECRFASFFIAIFLLKFSYGSDALSMRFALL